LSSKPWIWISIRIRIETNADPQYRPTTINVIAGINNTGGNFDTGGGQFDAGVVDTGGAP
jgi:hypothetical protein